MMIINNKYFKIIVLFLFIIFIQSLTASIHANDTTSHFVSIEEWANFSITGDRHKHFPFGNVNLGGVGFFIPDTNLNLFITNYEDYGWEFGWGLPTIATFSANIANPKSIYLLINGNNTYNGYDGEADFTNKIIGTINLEFNDSTAIIQEIIPGFNFRDWNLTHNAAIKTLDPNSNTVEVTPAQAKVSKWNWGPVAVDMMKIIIPNEFRDKTLNSITLKDESFERHQDHNPGIAIYGITVLSQMSDSKQPVILLPGHGGCWSTSGLVWDDPNASWQITPFVHVYDNLINTFLNNGYVENQDLFVYCYDWRQQVNQTADELKDFVDQIYTETGQKVNLVGHSMGGLVARTYLQKHDASDKVNKVVTVGSPLKGALRAYYGWEGGQDDNTYSWTGVAFQLYLQAKKGLFQTSVDTVRQLAPSTKDMLPTFDFLKNADDLSIISIDEMNQQNTWLANLNNAFSIDLKNLLNNVVGLEDKDDNSAEYYLVENQNWLDKLLGRWEDGKPIGRESTDQGDLTVLAKSATISGVLSSSVTADHCELVEKQDGISQILQALDLEGFNIASQTASPNRNPSLIFWLRSPATLKVITPDQQTYNTDDFGLLTIPQAQPGTYDVLIEPKGDGGQYHLTIGQITETGDIWQEINDTVYPNQTDEFSLNFNPDDPQGKFINYPTDWFLHQARQHLEELIVDWPEETNSVYVQNKVSFYLDLVLKTINLAIDNYNQTDYESYQKNIQNSQIYLFKAREADNNQNTLLYNSSQEIIDLLKQAHQNIGSLYGQVIPQDKVDRDFDVAGQVFQQSETKLQNLAQLGENKPLGNIFIWQEKLLTSDPLESWLSRLAGWEINRD